MSKALFERLGKMGTDKTNGRTHEPNLRELVADLDGLRELTVVQFTSLRDLIDERDRLYKERDDARRTAVDAALAAAKEQTSASFSASEKAIVKAETAQKDYNDRSNEFRGQLDDQAKRLIARTEVDTMIKNLEEKITRLDTDMRGLQQSRSEGAGEKGGRLSQQQFMAMLVTVVAALLFIGGVVVTVAYAIRKG